MGPDGVREPELQRGMDNLVLNFLCCVPDVVEFAAEIISTTLSSKDRTLRHVSCGLTWLSHTQNNLLLLVALLLFMLLIVSTTTSCFCGMVISFARVDPLFS